MKTLTVDLGHRAYPIHIGPDLLAAGELLPAVLGTANFVITDTRVASHYLDLLYDTCDDHIADVIVLPEGEDSKTLANVEEIIEVLTMHNASRDATLRIVSVRT